MNTQRVFFSLWPNDRQREQLRNAISPVAKLIEGSAIYRGSWHVTLAYIGAYPEARIPALLTAASRVHVDPIRLRFDRAEFWPRQKVAVLMAQTVPTELENLHGCLQKIVNATGLKPETRSFRPHITIVRRARSFETQRLAQPVTIEWSGFELMASTRGRDGSVYTPLKQ